jgi:hypothetical protein
MQQQLGYCLIEIAIALQSLQCSAGGARNLNPVDALID